jgi:DNA polymerase-3 subunit alpha
MDLIDDAIVLVKGRVNRRDDKVSLIANDLAVPDLAAATGGPLVPLVVSLRADHCTPERVAKLKDVLGSHPGNHEVHLRLVNGARATVLKLDDGLRVTSSSALMGDLKALLGPGCLG